MKIVISDDYQDCIRTLDCYPRLSDNFEVIIHNDTVDKLDQMVARFAEADALILIRERTPISAQLLERLPRLKFISQTGGAASHVDLAACTARGIPVAANGSASTSAAELTWALVMASMRKIHLEANRLKAGLWQGHLGHRLEGKTLGIIGYGKIGKLVARYGQAFGMKVVIWGRTENSIGTAKQCGMEVETDRLKFFADSDVISCHLRLSPTTRHLITKTDLLAMKPTALFVNTSRAGLVEPGALTAALSVGRPGYGAFDVFEQEPLDGNHPLLKLDNVLATPHIGYAEKETYERYIGIAIDQLLAWRNARPINLLNPEAWRQDLSESGPITEYS